MTAADWWERKARAALAVLGKDPDVAIEAERKRPAMTPAELFNLRCAAGLSQMDLARRLQMNGTTVWRWETGRLAISQERADKIRAACKPA